MFLVVDPRAGQHEFRQVVVFDAFAFSLVILHLPMIYLQSGAVIDGGLSVQSSVPPLPYDEVGVDIEYISSLAGAMGEYSLDDIAFPVDQTTWSLQTLFVDLSE